VRPKLARYLCWSRLQQHRRGRRRFRSMLCALLVSRGLISGVKCPSAVSIRRSRRDTLSAACLPERVACACCGCVESSKKGVLGSDRASDGRPRCCLHMCACDGRVGEAESANRGSSVVGTVSVSVVGSECMQTTSTCEDLTIRFTRSFSANRHANAFAQCQSSGHAHSDVRAPTVVVFREQDEEEEEDEEPGAAERCASRRRPAGNQISENNSKKNRSSANISAAFRLSAKQETLLCTLLVTRRGVAAAARAAGSTRAGPQCQAQTVA